jgi:hypothetical protein
MSMIIDGTNGLTFNNATTQASAGVVLQVVNATYATTVANSTTTFADTNLTVTITPKFATSKILVTACVNGLEKGSANATNSLMLRLLRAGTNIGDFVRYGGYQGATGTLISPSGCITYLDSPATTSATIYKVQFANAVASSFVNVQSNADISTITVMEIAG